MQRHDVRLPFSNYVPVQDGGADVAGDQDLILLELLPAQFDRVAGLLDLVRGRTPRPIN